MIEIIALAAVLSFNDVQCQYFRDAIYDHLIAANAADEEAQKFISDYELACVGTNSGWECIDDPMPGHVLKCRPFHLEADE